MIKIALVEGHNIVRNGIKTLLNGENDMTVVAEATNCIDIMQMIDDQLEVDIILTDINLPGMDGLSFCSKAVEKYPSAKVIVLTMYDQTEYINQAFKSGAQGYILKNVSPLELTFAIRHIVNRADRYICTELALRMLDRQLNAFDASIPENMMFDFTKRELEILALVSEGYTNQEIAERLYTSKRTVEGHRQSLIEKTGVRNSSALIRFAIINGLIK